jgi:hypothetical protein
MPTVQLPWKLTPTEEEAANRVATGYVQFSRSQTEFREGSTVLLQPPPAAPDAAGDRARGESDFGYEDDFGYDE